MKKDKQSKKEEEEEIIRRMYEDYDDPSKKNSGEYRASDDRQNAPDRNKKKKELIHTCPKCGASLGDVTMCPKCGYRGYMPISEKQTLKIKLILYPVLLVIAALVYLYVRGYFS